MPTVPTLTPIRGQPISVVLLRRDADPEPAVAAWRAFLEGRGQAHEIVVAEPSDDGAALRDGFARTAHPLICYAPALPEYRPEYLGRMLDKPFASEEEDAVSGFEIDHVHVMSGYRAGAPVPWPLRAVGSVYRLLGWAFLSYAAAPLPGWLGWRRHAGGFLARVIFAVHYRDAACPFRLVRREILARLPIQSDSSFAHVELIAKANFLGALLGEELPLDVRPGPARDGKRAWREARRLFDRPDFGPRPTGEAAT